MVRPATPLSVLFFVAFALLLLSALTTPVIKAIPLASFNGVTFGVWGYCKGSDCSSIKIGYSMQKIPGISDSDFSLPASARNSLSSILIIHPVAAGLMLICTILAIAAHFHSPAHSPRFLLGLFILTIPTILVSLLAFLVDLLLFLPHVSWGGWIVLAATIIVLIASLVTCGMRRSIVGRKARRKLAQENAEMNGDNYFNNLNAKRAGEPSVAISVADSLPRAESPPPLSGSSTAPLNDKSGLSFATYESKSISTPDDRIPLSSNTAPPAMGGSVRPMYGDPMRPRAGSGNRAVDEYGNPLPPGMQLRRPSNESNRSDPAFYGRGGRGGYPPGRGGYPPRGGPMMRGGPPGMRGGYRGRGGPGMGPPGPMMGRGGPPPGDYGPQDRYTPAPYDQGPRGMAPPGPYDQGPRGMPPQGPYDQAPRGMSPPGPYDQASRKMSPVPAVSIPQSIGQAVELDANNGGVPSPARSPVTGVPPAEPFIPARAQWNQKPPNLAATNRALSPIQASPVDSNSKYSQIQPGHARTASGSYYEDVEPRFAEVPPPSTSIPPPLLTASSTAIPPVLMTGVSGLRAPPSSNQTYNFNQGPPPIPLDTLRQESQESLQEGQRSPAMSDTSHFTSVSQRGINPNWRPPPGSMGPSQRGPPPPRPADMLLNSNPDFSLPGMGPSARGGRGGFRGRGGPSGPGAMGPGRQSPAMGMNMGSASGVGGSGLGQPSRYPMP